MAGPEVPKDHLHSRVQFVGQHNSNRPPRTRSRHHGTICSSGRHSPFLFHPKIQIPWPDMIREVIRFLAVVAEEGRIRLQTRLDRWLRSCSWSSFLIWDCSSIQMHISCTLRENTHLVQPRLYRLLSREPMLPNFCTSGLVRVRALKEKQPKQADNKEALTTI